MQQQISFLDSLSGKTSPAHSQATAAKTSKPSSRPLQTSAEPPMMLFLDLRGGGGNLLGAYWETVGALPGVSMMLNFGASPSVVRESTLSQILDLNAPEKYSLSPTACAGIIRRADKRGKELPSMLWEALMEVIGRAGGLDRIDEEPEKPEDELTDDDEDF